MRRLWAAAILGSAAMGQPTVQQHMMLVEPNGIELNVNETLIVSGQDTVTVPVSVPIAAGTPTVRNGTIAKTRTPGVFDVTVKNAMTEARVDLEWSIPFVVPETLSGRILHADGVVRMVFPKGVTVRGAALESNGVEPTTQAAIFTLKVRDYKLEIDGAGALRSQQAPAESPADEGPSIEQILPRLYDRLYWILGLTLAVLAIGFVINYRASVKG